MREVAGVTRTLLTMGVQEEEGVALVALAEAATPRAPLLDGERPRRVRVIVPTTGPRGEGAIIRGEVCPPAPPSLNLSVFGCLFSPYTIYGSQGQ